MNAYDFVHLSLLAIGGRITGKTKLQKTVYFLADMTGQLDELGYRPHYYGPYSSGVAASVGRLKSLGFLAENAVPLGGVDSMGFEVARHDFALTEQGTLVAKLKTRRHPDLWASLAQAAKKFKEAGDLDYLALSIAAKTYFMLADKENTASIGELVEIAGRFGWSVEESQVLQAAEFLQRLGLVRLTRQTK